MPRRLASLVVLAALGLGCVEFEEQTILARLDEAADTIHLRFVYRGIYAGDTHKADAVTEALGQLEDVAKGQRFFFFDNWPNEVDLAPPGEGEQDTPGAALFRPHTTVRNGTFFFDDRGRLCAWQDVEVRDARAFLENVNRFVTVAVLAGRADVYKESDVETQQRLREAMAKGFRWLSFGPRGIAFEAPLSDADAAKVKRAVFDEVVATVEKEKDRAAAANQAGRPADGDAVSAVEAMRRIFARNRFVLAHDGSGLALRLPADANGVVRLDWANKGTYVPNLVRPARQGDAVPELPRPLDRGRTLDRVIAGFPEGRPEPPAAPRAASAPEKDAPAPDPEAEDGAPDPAPEPE